MAALPYYLGGAMLYNCFRQGGDKLLAKKQGVGVVLYYAGMGLADSFVDSFVKHKYGVDLDLKYKNMNGEIRKVFESVDFTRWDLLTEKDWNQMGDKLGIPRDVPDRDTAIKDEVHKIIVRARAWKLVLGAAFAATGTGFIARSDVWKTLFKNNAAIKTAAKNVFAAKTGMPLMGRVANFGKQLWSSFRHEVVGNFAQACKSLPNKLPGRIAIAAVIGLPLLAIINLLKSPSKNKVYLTQQEAMPFASKVTQDEALRAHIESNINPNKVDYESLYTQIAKMPAQAIPGQQIAQTNFAPSPFDAFEAFMRGGSANG
ncbi:MAG: hypothetical protein AB1782_09690, partial [Cyanobacteriota bacterium]